MNNYINSSHVHNFHELVNFVFTILGLPLSSADVERVFSQMNVVKTKKSNKMQLSLLNAILIIKYGLRRANKNCYNYELSIDVLSNVSTMEKHSMLSGKTHY